MDSRIQPIAKYFTVDELFRIVNQPITEMSKSLKPTFFGTHSLKGIYEDRSVTIDFQKNDGDDNNFVILPSHITSPIEQPSESREAVSAKGHAGKVKRKTLITGIVGSIENMTFAMLLAELSVRPTVLRNITVSTDEKLDLENLLITAQNQSVFNGNVIHEFVGSEISVADEKTAYFFDLSIPESQIITPTTEVRLHGLGEVKKASITINFAESYALFD